MPSPLDAASGRWPELLEALAGLQPEQLTDRHQPCPACGGTDRYRWDRDDGPGGWFCNQCGGKDRRGGAGSGVDLLMRIRRWSLADATRVVAQHLGLEPGRPVPPPSPARPRKPRRPARIPEAPPENTPPPLLGKATAQFPYGPDPGRPWFWIQRVPKPSKPGSSKPGKLFVHRTWLDGRWHYPSRRDPFTSEWPAPRPMFNLPDLSERPEDSVLVVEGEGKALAAAWIFPHHVVVSGCGGTGGIRATDWAPLAGRTVFLWPDADAAGRQFMATLAGILLAIGATVSVVEPPEGVPQGWDLADADWTPEQAAAELEARAKPVELPPDPPAPPDPPEPPAPPATPLPASRPAPSPAAQWPFTCLGFDDGGFFYQPNETGQVIRISGDGHSKRNLLRLADLAWWEAMFPAKSGFDQDVACNRLFRAQAAVGIYSPDRIRGRGAWWDAGRSVLHLGDRLIVDGQTHPITNPPPTAYSYQRLARVDLPDGLTPLSDQEAAELLDLANRFLWEVPASGLLLAGWVALAPICGSLSWRPHCWLTAAASSGKSTLLDRFIGPLLDPVALFPEGATTEAFVRQALRSDAIPVVFDEAEGNERHDRDRIQNILALARVSSSSGRGVIGKGSADGAAQRFVIRSMFLLCSISTGLKQGADFSRFAQLTMRHPDTLEPDYRREHWQALDADLTRLVTAEAGQRLLLRSVQLIPVIREAVAVFRRAAGRRFDSQRQGDQYGTLLAGAWSLTSSHVPTEAEALALIDHNNWEHYRQAAEQPDEVRCVQALLQHQLRVEADRGNVVMRTVGELVQIAAGEFQQMTIAPAAAEALLERHGFRLDGDGLLISNTAQAIARILCDTPWATSWPTILSRLPGATRAGVTRFRGLGASSRAIRVPLSTL